MALTSLFLNSYLGLAILALYLWRLLSSPLRRVPGPMWSLSTSWVLKWHEFRANRTRYVHSLHEAYGPVVRIAPNELSFASAEGVKEIYYSSGSGYDKTEFYDLFRVYGMRNMFTTLDRNDHAKRKRVLADRYANTNILRSACIDEINERSRRFVDRCSRSHGGSADIFIALHAYAFDCVTLSLLHPYGSNSLQKRADEDIMRQVTFDDSLQNRLIEHHWPNLHKCIGRLLYFFAKPRETPLADSFVLSAISKMDPAPFTLLNRMQEKRHRLEYMDMAAECWDHMTAGIDTTGDALCFLIWELSQPRSSSVQARLQQEIRDNPSLHFDQLTYLEAVIHEGLRCFPAIPMSLPRYVPEEGRTIDGYWVPGGTVVSSQAYSTHRIDHEAWPEPERFDPDRWLEHNASDGIKPGDEQHEVDLQRRRRTLFFAFSGGGRGCIGRHLALAEMKVLLRNIYSQFSTQPDEALMTEDMMQMSDHLISTQPIGKRCYIRFVPLQRGEEV